MILFFLSVTCTWSLLQKCRISFTAWPRMILCTNQNYKPNGWILQRVFKINELRNVLTQCYRELPRWYQWLENDWQINTHTFNAKCFEKTHIWSQWMIWHCTRHQMRVSHHACTNMLMRVRKDMEQQTNTIMLMTLMNNGTVDNVYEIHPFTVTCT
jgi:hypothetical protein